MVTFINNLLTFENSHMTNKVLQISKREIDNRNLVTV